MPASLASRIHAANAAAFTEGNLGALDELFAPGYVVHLTNQDLRGGLAAVRKWLRALRRAFADLQAEVEILVKAKDRVAWQRTLRGTHERAYKGFAATGRRIVWRDMVTSRFRRGRIAEDWVITDLAERLLLARKR